MGSNLSGVSILVIDDDPNLCHMVELVFLQEGAEIYKANGGIDGLRQFYAHRPDLIILDVRMPDKDGWEVLRQIRLLADTPVILLTTIQDDTAMVRGLNLGADDFISKPFNNQVLLARTRSVLRRIKSMSVPSTTKRFSDNYLSIDLEKHQVKADGEPVKLTATEFRLLSYLLQNAGQVLSYNQILDFVWGSEYRESVDYVHVYLSHLRRKIEKDSRNPQYLLTEYGIGYRFERRNHA
jgi:two-component system KDP operon response regulator KdpE